VKAGSDRPGAFSLLLEEFARLPDVVLPSAYARTIPGGTRIGRFVIASEIGRGGFGVVYEAHDPELGRSVALKVLHPGRGPDRASGDGILREAEAVARLAHPGIVTLFDFGRTGDGAFLVFELLRGETLAKRLGRGPILIDEAARIARSVADALAHAHGSDVLHCDLKPGNVFLCEDGGVKVLDFGIARLFGRGDSTRGGTPAYMAPEQWTNEPSTGRTDLFALGIILFEMLTGTEPPGDVEATSTSRRVPLITQGTVPRALRRLVADLTAHDPAARPASAAEVSRRLARTQAARRNRTRYWAATLGAVALAALLFGVARSRPPSVNTERVTVAISDTVNATGNPDLDRAADLLRARLAESSRIQMLTPERLRLVGRRAGMPDVGALTTDQTRLLARTAGSDVTLDTEVKEAGGALVIHARLNALLPERTLLQFDTAPRGMASIAESLDEVVRRVSSALEIPEQERKGGSSRAHQEVTGSLAAYRQYAAGLDCIRHRSNAPGINDLERCGPSFKRALDEDPSFPLAHFQLAVLMADEGSPEPERRAHVDGLFRSLNRLPTRDVSMLRAWKAHVDGNDTDALAIYNGILADHPDDLDALFLAGNLLFEKGDRIAAIPYLTKVLDLDPQHDLALEDLIDAYGVTNRQMDLERLLESLGARPTPWNTHLWVRALIWLGRGPEAVVVAKRAVEMGGGRVAESDLRTAYSAAWDVKEVERLSRKQIAERPRSHQAWFSLVTTFLAQGRIREANALIEELPSRADGFFPGELASLRAIIAAGARDWSTVDREAQKTAALDAVYASFPTIFVALGGDPELARKLGAKLPPQSVAAQEVAALLAWREGRTAEALAALAAVEQRDPWPQGGLPPSYLVAEVASAAGDHREVIAAVQRLGRLWPRGAWRAWGWPRALLLSSRAHEAVGDLKTASDEVERVEQILRYSDKDYSLARQASEIRGNLAHRGKVSLFKNP
jgi:tetratricopeptide (TPR) repeat protein